MKKKITILLTFIVVLSVLVAQNGITTVYITAQGKKFHTKDCRTIVNSEVTQIDKEDAVEKGYKPCKICNP